MMSLGAKIVNGLVRLYTYKYRKRHLSLSRSVKFKNKPFKPPGGFTFRVDKARGVNVEIIRSEKSSLSEGVIHFHGGGHTAAMNGFYRKIALKYARLTGLAVYSIDFSVGAELRHPALSDECFNACLGLMESGLNLSRFAFVGDSMGANLLLSVCLKMRDAGINLPCALICVSPFADFGVSGPSYRLNCHADPMYSLPKGESYEGNEHLIRRSNPYGEGCDLKDPYLSPAFADLSGFPDMLIQIGGSEVSASDGYMLMERAKVAGVHAKLTAYQGLFHDFQYIAPFIKEGRSAWKELTSFIKESVNKRVK